MRRAAAAKRRADEEYRAALLAAAEAGAAFPSLAREIGVSRQAVRMIIERARR